MCSGLGIIDSPRLNEMEKKKNVQQIEELLIRTKYRVKEHVNAIKSLVHITSDGFLLAKRIIKQKKNCLNNLPMQTSQINDVWLD